MEFPSHNEGTNELKGKLYNRTGIYHDLISYCELTMYYCVEYSGSFVVYSTLQYVLNHRGYHFVLQTYSANCIELS